MELQRQTSVRFNDKLERSGLLHFKHHVVIVSDWRRYHISADTSRELLIVQIALIVEVAQERP